MASTYRHALMPALTYGLLALGAVWLLWTSVEIRHLQSWYEAQGVDRFYYPYVEITAGALALIAGLILARRKNWAFAGAIAVVVLLTTEMFWMGFTR